MIQKMKNKKSNKKGFTLVELIVVLVILGILIAMLVPTLTGYIDKANKQKAQANAKMLLTATQSMAAEEYQALEVSTDTTPKGNLITDGTTAIPVKDDIKPLGAGPKDPDLVKLAEIGGKYATGTQFLCDKDGTVKEITFVSKDEKYKAVYTNDKGTTKWAVTKEK